MASFLVAPQGVVRQQAAPLTCPVAPRSLCTRLPSPTWLTPVHLPSRSTFRCGPECNSIVCAPSDVFGLQEFLDMLPGGHVLSDAASAFAGEAAGLPSSNGEAPCNFCGPPQSGSESDSSSGGSHGGGSGNGADVPPPVVAGPFDGDALTL